VLEDEKHRKEEQEKGKGGERRKERVLHEEIIERERRKVEGGRKRREEERERTNLIFMKVIESICDLKGKGSDERDGEDGRMRKVVGRIGIFIAYFKDEIREGDGRILSINFNVHFSILLHQKNG